MPDVFYITTSASNLYRLDLNGWTPGKPVHPEPILHFPEPVRGLNGSCVVAPGLILLADCFSSSIWRVDLSTRHGKPKASVWLRHDSMGYFPGQMKPEQPGVNGVQYSPKRGYLYYTSTAKQLFMRVKVEPETYDPVGEPEVVGGGRMFDACLSGFLTKRDARRVGSQSGVVHQRKGSCSSQKIPSCGQVAGWASSLFLRPSGVNLKGHLTMVDHQPNQPPVWTLTTFQKRFATDSSTFLYWDNSPP